MSVFTTAGLVFYTLVIAAVSLLTGIAYGIMLADKWRNSSHDKFKNDKEETHES